MAAPAYEQLLVVQGFDTTLDQIRHKVAHHPIRTEIDAIDADASTLQVQIDEIEGRKHELDRQVKRLADEVSLLDDKRSKIDAKLYDGSVTATKDLLVLQDETKMLLDRKNTLEDEELDLMESVEVVQSELSPAASEMEKLNAAKSDREAALEAALAQLEIDIETNEALRGEAATSVPADLLTHYGSLRSDFGGVAVAKLVGSTCDGCHMALSAVAIDLIKKQPDDAVVTCDQCGRLLIR